jgi:hypothetical protein
MTVATRICPDVHVLGVPLVLTNISISTTKKYEEDPSTPTVVKPDHRRALTVGFFWRRHVALRPLPYPGLSPCTATSESGMAPPQVLLQPWRNRGCVSQR